MRYEYFVDLVERGGGFDSREAAERAISATVDVLGELLPSIDVESVADQLPPELAGRLQSGTHRAEFDDEELYRRVGAREGVDVARAREHAHVVCQELTQVVTGEGRDHLRLHLPDSVARLFTLPHEWPDAPERPHHHPRRTRPLSESRAGSRQPLSEGRPHGHRDSVAESESPHEDRKISTGRASYDDDSSTLGRGKPGSEHPLSEGEE